MKQPAPLVLAAVSLLVAAGCKRQPTPEQQEQEVERRVAQKLAEERLGWQRAMLDQKSKDLATKEQQLNQREQEAATAADSGATLEDYLVGNDRVGGGPCSSYNVFYKYLSPYGAWFDVPYYGLVWQPAVAANNPNWRPYTAGQWAYSSDVGWTWISAEPFGWATYHYGRWTLLAGVGWIWAPGIQWAPAWVAWRDSNDYVGWAPLPPEVRVDDGASVGPEVDSQGRIATSWYSFVPFISFGEQNLSGELVSPDETGDIINRSTNVTHISSTKTGVVNLGPQLGELQHRSHSPIPILKVVRKNVLSPEQQRPVENDVLEVPSSFIAETSEPTQLPQKVITVAKPAAPRPPQTVPAQWTQATPVPQQQPQPQLPDWAIRSQKLANDPAAAAVTPQRPQIQAQTAPQPSAPTPWSAVAAPAPKAPAVEEPRRIPERPREPEPPRQHESEPVRTPQSSSSPEPAHEDSGQHSKGK